MNNVKLKSVEYYTNGIQQQDRIILSKAITLIESTHPEHEKIAQQILQFAIHQKKQSKRIGISGVPGVGKSTFINSFCKHIAATNKIAILTIDPSSSISSGSILADKTRMNDIAQHQNIFIRPTASSTNLGGVAHKTYETVLLCEAFGFDYILIETVGVGQSEYELKQLCDLFLLLVLPNAGDELQTIKKGIMELADFFLVNKADINNIQAQACATQISNNLTLISSQNKHKKEVHVITAIQHIGIEELLKSIEKYFQIIDIPIIRKTQTLYWNSKIIEQKLIYKLLNSSKVKFLVAKYEIQQLSYYEFYNEFNESINQLLPE